MRRCVVIGGASITDYDVIRSYLKPEDFIICCDSGLKHREGLGVVPDLVIGDFDSHANPNLAVETIVLPREKDDTDTMAAVRDADARGFTDFLLLGVFGGRLDHTLANVYILLWLENRGKMALAVDDLSEIELVSPRRKGLIADRFPYFSLLNITGAAEGVTIRNAKYTLEHGGIPSEWQFAVSNEPLPGCTAEVTVESGALLLIKDRNRT